LAKETQNIFLTKKETLQCKTCKIPIKKGDKYVAFSEKHKGTCFECSIFTSYSFLPPGDVAMTRRSKKYSDHCGVLLFWNQRRKRFERKGQYVELSAILEAKKECSADYETRLNKNKKAAIKREETDKQYIIDFSKIIKVHYPSCPNGRELDIAKHACLKHSGRVGRTAKAKEFDKKMIDLAVEAHIRHLETNYDNEFNKGIKKRQIRANLKYDIMKIMASWKSK